MDIPEATRQILWNIPQPINSILMYALLTLSIAVGVCGILRHAEIWCYGKDDPDRRLPFAFRFFDLLSWGLFQRGVNQRTVPAVAHTLIYLGFLVLLFATTMVFLEHDLGISIYHGAFYLAVTLLSDLFGLGLIIGCAIAAKRRYVNRSDLLHNRRADAVLLIVLVLLCVQGFILEGLRIHVTDDPWAWYSPVGNLFAGFFWGLSPRPAQALHFFIWWFHTLTVFAAIALAPYTKFFHIIASSANLFFKSSIRPKGALPSPGDVEKMVESGQEFSLGLGSIKDYSWKNLLDLDACTSCGRCQDACPAYNTGKPLSPKWLILDSRNHMLALHAKGELQTSFIPEPARTIDGALTINILLKGSGLVEKNGEDFSEGLVYAEQGKFRASNPLVQTSARQIGKSPDDLICGDVVDPNVFWSCTTCMACVQACPVGINHVDQIIGNRRNSVLMQGKIPEEAQKTLRALETRGNPYGPAEDRVKWLADLEVPIVTAGSNVDYLYWVGCVSAYDPRKQKIARALVSLMKKAGLSFGVLGSAEGCSGDPARRLGEENLFQSLAKKNIELLKSIKFKSLVANCPHCFNTIKNEYPQFGNLGDGLEPEIIHHSVLLRRLVAEQKLTLKESAQEFTFHDPCYLGRYNEEYDAPRQSLRAVKGLRIIEMEQSRENAMCCGAGGGHFWMDLKIGERVNVRRIEQAALTQAPKIAAACPFCLQMLEDGVKLTGREGKMEIKDIAEVLAENCV